MRILLASLAAIALTFSAAGCAQSTPSGSFDASTLVGTWTGSNLGYENGMYQERQIRLVVEESTGTTFSGSKAWRELGGDWSAPETFAGSVLNSTEFHVADSDGYIIGTIESASSIHATYLEAGADSGVFALDLTKTAP
jgi:hypothetical protein